MLKKVYQIFLEKNQRLESIVRLVKQKIKDTHTAILKIPQPISQIIEVSVFIAAVFFVYSISAGFNGIIYLIVLSIKTKSIHEFTHLSIEDAIGFIKLSYLHGKDLVWGFLFSLILFYFFIQRHGRRVKIKKEEIEEKSNEPISLIDVGKKKVKKNVSKRSKVPGKTSNSKRR